MPKYALSKVLMGLAKSLVLLSGCKKDADQEASTFDKIVGQWMGQEVYYEETPPGQPVYSETEDISAYNFDFRADGTLVMDSAGFNPETLQWSVANANEIIWRYSPNDAEVFTITLLNGSSFHMEIEDVYDDGTGTMIPTRDVIKLRK